MFSDCSHIDLNGWFGGFLRSKVPIRAARGKDCGVKVALTYPYCWPEVRRGGERLFHDIAGYLVSTGIDVTSVSAQPRSVRPAVQPGRVRLGRAWADRRLPRGVVLDRPVTYLPGAALALARTQPDVVHGLFHLDGVAARLARPFTGRVPYLVHVQGMPLRANLDRLKAHRKLFWASTRGADQVLAVSRAAAEALQQEFGVTATAFYNGVFTEPYGQVAFEDRAPEPVVFFPADPGDPRKRVEHLAEAVSRLSGDWRACRLEIAGDAPPDVADRIRARLGDRVEFVGVLDEVAMIRSYARAWVTCLPAVREAFGLVIVEALAAGRPCVAVRDGGVPEILGSAPWMAEPDSVDSLASALSGALANSESPETVDLCRRMAEPFDWKIRGPALVSLYRGLLS